MRAIIFFLVLVLSLITSNAHGQDLSFDKNSKSDIQLGLSYSFDTNLSSDNIVFDQNSGYNTNYNQSNFTAGFNMQYFFLKNLAFSSGVSYSLRQFDGIFYCLNCFTTDYQLEKFSLQFLQVPTTVKYYPYQNKVGFFGELGFLNQFMIGKTKHNRLKGNRYSISALMGAGAKYNVGCGLTAQLSAIYTSNLSEIFKEADYSYKLFGFQLSVLKQL